MIDIASSAKSRAAARSIPITARQKTFAPQWSLTAALAGLPLALIAVGPAIVADVGGRKLPIYASQLAIAVLVIHIGFSVLARRNYGDVPVTARWLLVAMALLAVPLIWSTDPAAGTLAYLNFASGTVGGIAIAQIWKTIPRDYSWIDVGYTVFLIAGVGQLLVRYSGASSVNSLHQSSPMPWGVSSVVAGALVVGALTVMARSTSMGRHRKYAVLIGLATIGVALLTLTRGAIIAAAVGAIFFLWTKSGQHRSRARRMTLGTLKQANTNVLIRLIARMLAVLIPIAAFIAIERATELRAELNGQVYTNIDTRFEMYRLAWEEFVKSPLTGTGWASFREASLMAGESQTFPHNLVLSMLQIGGLLSLPYLVALSLLAYRALKHGGPYTAAVAASIAISMTQPFFESTVCNLIVLPVAFLAGLSAAEVGGDQSTRIVAPTRSTGIRLRSARSVQPELASLQSRN
ncbi:O-antigen ligase family protein [Mycobacterium sp. URHB0044]|uniref:O-antigen ligase family protein n=1 Tax=Mycobacterium sp. URHB0044 TaxID=1380386 RepID=UPI00048C7549|nr:O-antigen ligase family protein [Mycobacterium sp. URHB0044]